jgi:hypothetical protein
MGLGGYFKNNKKDASQKKAAAAASSTLPLPMTEKPRSGFSDELELHSPRFGSSRASLAPSTHSSFVDEIKHEVMCNYLYQQQCSHLWVSDGTGELEGILLRKGRNAYMACPPQLATSQFAQACAQLNVQVSLVMHRSKYSLLTDSQ